jgi:hypothetical protein
MLETVKETIKNVLLDNRIDLLKKLKQKEESLTDTDKFLIDFSKSVIKATETYNCCNCRCCMPLGGIRRAHSTLLKCYSFIYTKPNLYNINSSPYPIHRLILCNMECTPNEVTKYKTLKELSDADSVSLFVDNLSENDIKEVVTVLKLNQE